MADVLVDTDVFIDHLRARTEFEPRNDRVRYSVLTRSELYAGRRSAEAVIDELLSPFEEVIVDRSIGEEAGRIRRATGIPLPDAVIAASATTLGLTLLTRNRRDFERVRGLRIREPR
ncbi:MAG: PIN domain-containing protein [Actinobacteria bacterium]|nr:PIN domain-containing protein [Actinomycetota bacterium]